MGHGIGCGTLRRVIALVAALLSVECTAAEELSLDRIKLPPGFEIHLYATGVPNARSMALGPNGTLFVGTMDEGNVGVIYRIVYKAS